MSQKKLKIDHINGRVEVTAIDADGKPTSGTLVCAKPDIYDSLSMAELLAALPPLESGRVETDAAKVAKPVSKKRKRAPKA